MTSTILARQPGKLGLCSQDAKDGQACKSLEPASTFAASLDGSKLYVAHDNGVDVYSTLADCPKLASIPEPGVCFVALSPIGGFLVTCQKPSKVEGEKAKNLKVWDLSTMTQVFSYFLKAVNKDIWPAVSWAADDSTFAVAVPNAAHVFSAADGFATFTKVTIKNLHSLALCPTNTFGRLVAGFVPEAKGSPAATGLYDAEVAGEPAPRARKAFYRTQGAEMKWNSQGTALLVMSFADMDATNQSYYGEQKLHYLPADPKKADAVTTVPLPKEGPVHDVQWSPTGDFFITVAGFMPSKATLWDSNCKPIYDFGSGPYSVVRWNPFGRFIALAGFGNLPGDILFFDKKTSGACRQMGATRMPAVNATWSPDGRQLLISTVAPRMRVDNKAQILSYTGELINTIPFDCLFEAVWLPAAPGTYPDRPASPQRIAGGAASGGAGPKGSSGVARPSGYVPPHMRGVSGAADAAAASSSFSLGFDAADKGGKIVPGSSACASSVASFFANRVAPPVPGFDFVDGKAAAKNAKKRANKAAKAPADGQGATQAATASSAVEAPAVAPAAAEGAAGAEGGDASADPVKRARALQKKLRLLQPLKDKLAQEGEASLSAEQMAKISGEAALVEELRQLGVTP
eukprot:CAMPEP_0119115726 /NCGR_PEP_ID=MMETSP1180-20130426/51898_1 /TAXON_ID=3052 ORGANISM="Chlamydomonas cf sp, Strain CCMP681" /NCGR_SAMPLE_ID=MMETSP1180 /ASSEMBLY_ACC=CAM_ASM_000741 /LENGTH=630 /DNA_ID=CAMNT_0007104815 /DNA_START=17 /DNA_END=1909 /DNA_ORIENTATION=-